MQALLAIARLTLKSAFRYRLVPVLAALLVGGVLLLPATIKSDGTARGMTQIVLSYTLGLTTAVLGLTTLWLACNTLAHDIAECQMQMVAVKPVARWQIWLGKWLGIMFLNLLLLLLAGGIVYVQMLWRAERLSPDQQKVLRNEVFIARGSFKPPVPDLTPAVDEAMKKYEKDHPVTPADRAEVRKIIKAQVQAAIEEVPPGYTGRWRLNMSAVAAKIRQDYLFLRIKFVTGKLPALTPRSYIGHWIVGPSSGPQWESPPLSETENTFHTIALPPNLLSSNGVLTVRFVNHNNTALLFPLKNGIEVLYRKGGFFGNYARGLIILFCWMGLLAAMGLAAASFLSFPVAAFVSLGLLILAFSTGIMQTIIQQGTIGPVDHRTGKVANPDLFDTVSVGAFKVLLGTINLARDFSPVQSLSGGRMISWLEVLRAFGQIVVLMGGVFAVIGMSIFERRELATAQGKT